LNYTTSDVFYLAGVLLTTSISLVQKTIAVGVVNPLATVRLPGWIVA